MDYSLHNHEKALLLALKKGAKSQTELAKETTLESASVAHAALWLSSKGLATLDEQKTQYAELNKEGKSYLKSGLPERQALEELKSIKLEYRTTKDKLGIKDDPLELKKRIEKIEFRIETEPMSFDKEKGLMKDLKKLKKSYAEGKALKDVAEKEDKLRKDIRALRSEATKYHKQVQDHAAQSQDHHEALLGDSTEINTLREQEEEAYKKFFDFKQKFAEASNELKEQIARLRDIKDQLDQKNIEIEAEEKEQLKKVLDEKEKEVEEKIKKTRKLTTEDLLILQAKETIRERKASASKQQKSQRQERSSKSQVSQNTGSQ